MKSLIYAAILIIFMLASAGAHDSNGKHEAEKEQWGKLTHGDVQGKYDHSKTTDPGHTQFYNVNEDPENSDFVIPVEKPTKYKVTIEIVYNSLSAAETIKIITKALKNHRGACKVNIKTNLVGDTVSIGNFLIGSGDNNLQFNN